MLRRDLLHSMGALGATAAAGFTTAARAQDYVDISSLGYRDINYRNFSSIKGYKNIGVLNYHIGLVVQNGMKASGNSGSTTVDSSIELTGLTLERIQSMAGQAQADFISQVSALGKPMLSMADMTATKAYGDLRPTPQPYRKQPATDTRRVLMMTPHDQPLFLTAADSPLTDKSPFDQKSAMAMHKIGLETEAIILVPTVVFDFAELSGSGHSVYSGSAHVDISPGLFMVELFSGLGAYHARNKVAGDGGRATLTRRIRLGQGGQMVKASQYDNNDEVQWWNARARAGLLLEGEIGPSLAYSISSYRYEAEPDIFEAECLRGARAMNRAYVQAIAQIKAG